MASRKNTNTRLMTLYNSLFDLYGPQDWWPGDSPWEICVGAVLTQNTNWQNVEKAILNLKRTNLLDVGEGGRKPEYYTRKLLKTQPEKISELIKPSGFFNIKTNRLKAVAQWWVNNTQENMPKFNSIDKLRESLLSVNGIGPETADSIILYCFNIPSFVIDTYTKRICSIYLETPIDIDYHQLQSTFIDNLPLDYRLFNEFHALLVQLGKQKDWKQITKSI